MDTKGLLKTRWLPYTAIAAAIPLAAGFALHLAEARIIVSVLLAVALVFGGLVFRSYGMEREKIDYQEKDSEKH